MKPEEIVIDLLYKIFQKQGYVTEEDIYELCEKYDLSFVKTDYVGNQILARGVMISEGAVKKTPEESNEEASVDYAQVNYEEIYADILKECPGLAPVVMFAKRVTPPQKGELRQLFEQMNSGNPYAREMLINKYIRVALRFTLYYCGKTKIPLDDIFSVSMIGIMKAVDSYDQYSNSNFSSYVTWWMKQNVDRYIADHENTIRLPVHFLEKIKKVKELAVLDYSVKSEEIIAQIAEELQTTYAEAELLYKQLENGEPDSIEEILERDGEISTHESIELEPSVEDIVEQRFHSQQVLVALSKLSAKEKQVIELRYGLADGTVWTLEEVGQILSVTRERVRQIEAKALRKLKHPSISKYLGF